ncbi:MAG: hypothetical protein IPI83_07550 [Sphingomonadales bacterium]|nr:hypothetical protein [Sphingomonadales bacterium]
MKALIARDERIEYTFVFDRPPQEAMPVGAKVLSAATRRALNESHEGDSSRSMLDLLRMAWAVRKANFDVFFFPLSIHIFPFWAGCPVWSATMTAPPSGCPSIFFPSRSITDCGSSRPLWRCARPPAP